MSSAPLPTVLLVDADAGALDRMEAALEGEFDCLRAGDCDTALSLLAENFVQVILCAAEGAGCDCNSLLAEARERWPETVRIIAGVARSDDMLQAINAAGVYHYLPQPVCEDQLRLTVRNAATLFQLARENDRLSLEMRYLGQTAESRLDSRRATLSAGLGFDGILRGPASPVNAAIDLARQYAGFDVPALIEGEAGTGKLALARAMHYGSLRAEKPFFDLDAAGMSDDLLELELFGGRNGGGRTKAGLVQKADRGTLYLGGVETLSPRLQLALLRLLRDGAFQSAGGHETLSSQARILTGANCRLADMVAAGVFRADLFYALSVTQIALPPLRDRRCDIGEIAQEMLFDLAAAHGKPVQGLSDTARRFLADYDWPGNLPELRNEITRMLIFASGPVLGPDLISRHILQASPAGAPAERAAETVMMGEGTLKDRVEAIEARILRETLTRLKWNKSRAAAELGLSRVGLRAKLDRYGVAPPPEPALEEG